MPRPPSETTDTDPDATFKDEAEGTSPVRRNTARGLGQAPALITPAAPAVHTVLREAHGGDDSVDEMFENLSRQKRKIPGHLRIAEPEPHYAAPRLPPPAVEQSVSEPTVTAEVDTTQPSRARQGRQGGALDVPLAPAAHPRRSMHRLVIVAIVLLVAAVTLVVLLTRRRAAETSTSAASQIVPSAAPSPATPTAPLIVTTGTTASAVSGPAVIPQVAPVGSAPVPPRTTPPRAPAPPSPPASRNDECRTL